MPTLFHPATPGRPLPACPLSLHQPPTLHFQAAPPAPAAIMKILRTRENGRPHPRAKEKLGSLSHPSRVIVPFSFSFPSSLHLSLSISYSPPFPLIFSLLSTRGCTRVYGHVLHGRRRRWRGLVGRGAAEVRLIPVPRGSRSTPHLREGVAASQTFRAETRFLTGNFVRLRLPHLTNGSFFVGGSLVVGVLRVQSLHARTILYANR